MALWTRSNSPHSLSRRNSSRRRPLRIEALEPRNLLAVVINEIHYNPNDSTEKVEFLELHNSGPAAVNISGWRIDEAVNYTFPDGSTIAAGGFLVITQDAADFQAKYGFAPYGQWEVGDKLSNEGETIELRDAANVLVDTVTYRLGFPWPTTGDFGSSLELINPALDNDLAGSWRSSGLSAVSNAGQVLLASGSTWRYRKGTSEPPAAWKQPGFSEASDPTAWQSGITSIGFGDEDDNTILADMQGNYSTFYARNTFTVSDSIPHTLKLRLYVDDGAIIYLNGLEVLRPYVGAGTKTYNSTAQNSHEAQWEEYQISNAASYLTLGTNTIAVHVLNQSISSSDVSFNLELSIPTASVGPPTPGGQNSVYASNAPPQMRQLSQSVQQPTSGQSVTITIKATDPDGVQSVSLEYQLLDPGSYIRMTDAAYDTNWTTLVMRDDGTSGDAVVGDSIYTVVLPGSLHTNRRLVRYRITATDTLGASVRGPYADDPQPNFAYFVYDGIPGWTGANQPGVTAPITFSAGILQNGPAAYHLIANNTDVINSQYNSSYQDTEFYGTLVYDGVVYDHVTFQVRGEYSTFVSGKNKWRINFNRGHEFAARDNYGNLYQEKWRRMNLNANASPWAPHNRGMAGLDEAVSFRIYQLAGVPAPNTNYVQFRVVDAAQEAPANQYDGDLWGLYLAVENVGGRFIDEHGLEDGNIYEIEGGQGDSKNQAPDQPSNGSDWIALRNQAQSGSAPESFWRQNLNVDILYSFDAINRAVSNVDVRPGDNYLMYHSPDGRWQIIPWDLDMMYIAETHQTGATYLSTYFSNVRLVPALEIEFKNRARELLDLMFSDASRTGGQVAQLVDEFARMVNASNGSGEYLPGWAEIDQFLWNFHPRTTSSHRGAFYKTPFVDNQRFGGQWTRTLTTPDFGGMVQWVIDFMTDTDPGSWSIGDGDQRGYGFNYLEYEAADPNIPHKPWIIYSGTAGYPIDGLRFSTSAFNDPNGNPFAAIEWRIGEISNPSTPGFDPNGAWKYEVSSVWESGELSTYAGEITVPGSALDAGHTYRARVRMKDSTGRWSHWSDPLEFVANEAASPITLVISEINYNPPDNPNLADPEDLEFIEIFNYGAMPVSLAGVRLTEFISPSVYEFDAGLSLAPGERIVVARDPAVFQSVYGSAINLAPTGFKFDGKNLSNSGERVVLLGPAGEILSDITYTDDPPWPTAADGNGPSLEIVSPRGAANDPANWRASLADGGSPGTDGVLHSNLPGDYDGNGIVEQADLSVWKFAFSIDVFAFTSADGNGDGKIDAADFTVWRDNLGKMLPPTFDNLVLTIDPATGQAQITNYRSSPIALIGYSILSTDAALLPADGSWNSLQDQLVLGWEEAAPTSAALSELSTGGALVLPPLASLELGHLLNTSAPHSGISFEFVLTTSSAAEIGDVQLAELGGSGQASSDHANRSTDQVIDVEAAVKFVSILAQAIPLDVSDRISSSAAENLFRAYRHSHFREFQQTANPSFADEQLYANSFWHAESSSRREIAVDYALEMAAEEPAKAASLIDGLCERTLRRLELSCYSSWK